MARVTIEDCLQVVDNRFKLIAMASDRARALAEFQFTPLVERENDRDTVVALREIAAGHTNFEQQMIEPFFDDAD